MMPKFRHGTKDIPDEEIKSNFKMFVKKLEKYLQGKNIKNLTRSGFQNHNMGVKKTSKNITKKLRQNL